MLDAGQSLSFHAIGERSQVLNAAGASHLNRSAIGLIETRGLLGVIEAADVAAKAADVELLAIDEVGGGLATVRMAGDVASVQSAVAAGAAAAARIAEVISHHVIPSPHEELAPLTASSGARVASDNPESYSLEQLLELPVTQLRQLVRQTTGVQIKGRAVSRANKEALIAELERVREADRDDG